MRGLSLLGGFLLAAVMAACAADPETAYRIAAARAEYQDGYYAGKRACEAEDGYVVVRGPLPHRNGAPEFGSLYWCSHR